MAKHKTDDQKGFILYKDTGALIKKLTLEDAGRLINAVFDYEVDGITPDNLPPAADMAFAAIQNYLDRDAAAYRDKCEKNAENGRKGGLATQERARKSEANQANASKAKANQADKEKDININSNIEIDTEIETDFKGERYKGAAQKPASPAPLVWPTFEKAAKDAYKEAHTSYSLDDCLEIFKYFFKVYAEKTGESHPALNKKVITDIMNNMNFALDAEGREFVFEKTDYPAMIDQYFDTKFNDCDYHITHFFSGDIRLNRFYEAVL